MAASRALRRLLRVLDIQEGLHRAALDTAFAELNALERAQDAAANCERGGRQLIAASTGSGESPDQLVDRLAGLEESLAASRAATALALRAADAEENVALCRDEFLAKRVERRQAESLVHKAEAADVLEAARRSQQSLDDWYLDRMHRGRMAGAKKEECKSAVHPSDISK